MGLDSFLKNLVDGVLEPSENETDEFSDEEITSILDIKSSERIQIDGIDRELMTAPYAIGANKMGYKDKEEEILVQVPKDLEYENFERALEQVNTWKQNYETLEQADHHLDEILDRDGVVPVNRSTSYAVIDYNFLNENEEMLRRDVEGGIASPTDNCEVLITSFNGEPLPVLVSDYNSDITEAPESSNEDFEEIQKRRKLLGTYMHALVEHGYFEASDGDFWFFSKEDPEIVTNTFYNPETLEVGVSDLGEKLEYSEEPDMPNVTLPKEEYR